MQHFAVRIVRLNAFLEAMAIHRIGVASDAVIDILPASFAVLLGAISADYGHCQNGTRHVVQDQAGANLARVELGAGFATFEAAWIIFGFLHGTIHFVMFSSGRMWMKTGRSGTSFVPVS